MSQPIVKAAIRCERDTVIARQIAQHVADLAGMSTQDKTKLATAVSEIARNALKYADGGNVVFNVIDVERKQFVEFVISDEGPGILNLSEILGGRYVSKTGMGQGIVGSRKLMDRFSVETGAGSGTRIVMAKEIPEGTGRVTIARAGEWAKALTTATSDSAVEEIVQEHQEMSRTVSVLRQKEAELSEQLRKVEKLNQELKAAKEALKRQATIDVLTELPNRRSILGTLDQELARCQRTGQPVGVVMADLDHFKKLNDTWGHLAGDAVLKETGRRMKDSARPYDSVGRYGGEEFIMIMPRCAAEDALMLADRLREAIGDNEMKLEDGTFNPTLSLGVATSDFTKVASKLIDIADLALYRAKANGRNRAELATQEDADQVLDARPTSMPISRASKA